MSIYTQTARFDTGRALTEAEMRRIAPSIFASSRSAVGVKSVLTVKPPVDTCSTTGLVPSTIRAPV